MTTAVSTRPSLSFFRCRVFQLEFYYGHASDTAPGPSPGHCLRQQGGVDGGSRTLGHCLMCWAISSSREGKSSASDYTWPLADRLLPSTMPSTLRLCPRISPLRRFDTLLDAASDSHGPLTTPPTEKHRKPARRGESDDPGNGNNQGNNNETESDKVKENERRTTRRKWNLSAGRGEDLQSSKAPSAHPASSPSTPPPRRTPTCTPRAARTCARTGPRPSGPTA